MGLIRLSAIWPRFGRKNLKVLHSVFGIYTMKSSLLLSFCFVDSEDALLRYVVGRWLTSGQAVSSNRQTG